MRSVWTLLVLAGLWQLLSGMTKPLICSFGAVSCVLVLLLMRRMTRFDGHGIQERFGLRPVFYLFWLMREIVKANLHLARVLLSPKMPIEQAMLTIDARAKTEVGQVVFGNSITLTPGTTTLDIRDGHLLVHSLTKDCTDDVLSGGMNAKVAWLETGDDVAPVSMQSAAGAASEERSAS